MSRFGRFGKRKRTVTRTFRIREEWDGVLREEAERQGVSVNVLLNKLLRKYSLFGRWSDRNSDVSLPQRTLKEILGAVGVEGLAEAGARSGGLDAVNMVNAMGLRMDYDSFVYLVTEHLGGPHFARWFQCFHHTQGNKDIFHIQHDLGHGWSAYLSNYLTFGLKTLTDVQAKTRVRDYSVNMEVTLPRIEHIAEPRKINPVIAMVET